MSQPIQPSWIPWVLYPAGDLIAQLILGEVNWARLLALSATGGILYQFEVPRWFRWLDQRTVSQTQLQRLPALTFLVRRTDDDRYVLNWRGRTLGAMSYFSPLWITRHMLVLKLATTPWSEIVFWPTLGVLGIAACKSFLINLPFSLLGNYIIQVRLPLQYRFLGSIIMTGLFSIAFALAFRFFS